MRLLILLFYFLGYIRFWAIQYALDPLLSILQGEAKVHV
jgi:hypothetical protein